MNTINSNATDQLFLRVMKYLVIFAPAIVYISFVQQFALNLPHWDDYDAILDFLNNFTTAKPSDKFNLLLTQQNEHRILSSRLVYVIYYYVFGSFNFRNIILLNCVVLTSIFLIFLSFIKKVLPVLWPLAALALSLCMFDIDNFENADFAMAGMQNYGVILLFVGSIFFYNKQGMKYMPLAVLMQGLCVFSSGNGNVASFFIVLFLLLTGNKKNMLISLACLLIFAPLYYVHYDKKAALFFTTDIPRVVPFFLHAIGAHFGYTLGVVMGAVLIVGYLVVFPVKNENGWKLKPGTAFFLTVAGFCFASMLVMSVFRAALPMETSYSSRYFVYTHLLVAIFFVLLLVKTDGKNYQIRMATLSLLVLLGFYRKNYNFGKAGFESFYHTIKTSQFDYPESARERAQHITDDACKKKIYCLEEARSKIK